MAFNQEETPSLKAWGLLVLLAIIWGSSFILIKKGLIALDSGEVGALRIVAAWLFLLPIAIKNISKISRKDLSVLITVGFAGTFIPAFLFAIAQTKLDSALTGVFNALTPVWVLVLGIIFFSHIIHTRQVVGVFLGFLGSALLILIGSNGSFENINYYALYVIAATVLYGCNLNIIKKYLGHLKGSVITAVSVLFVGPLAAIYLFSFTGFVDKMGVEPAFWEAFFYIILLGTMSTGIALIIFNNLVQITTPIFTSSVTYLIPIVAIGWGILDGEVLLISHYGAMTIILAGVYLVNKK
ncbi:MAG: DMT family transporter [Cyclobacteriaceae bacterium]